jgi:hypothetical protein
LSMRQRQEIQEVLCQEASVVGVPKAAGVGTVCWRDGSVVLLPRRKGQPRQYRMFAGR